MTMLLGYRLYRTDDMQELILWMRSYNETVPEEEKVRLYGIDIQNSTSNIRILKEFYGNETDPALEKVMYRYSGHLACLLFQSKNNICLILKKVLKNQEGSGILLLVSEI